MAAISWLSFSCLLWYEPVPYSICRKLTSFTALSLRAFMQRRSQFTAFLSSNKTLTASRYFRLMALAVTEMICTVPLSIFIIWLNATAAPIEPWRGLSDAHFDFSRVEQIPAVVWRRNHLVVVSLELSRWLAPVCAIIFFVFFGFAEEARRQYRMAFWTVMKPFGLTPPSPRSSMNPPPSSYVISFLTCYALF